MIKTLKKTKLSESVTSYRIAVGQKRLRGETIEVRYDRYLAKLKNQGKRLRDTNLGDLSAGPTIDHTTLTKRVRARRS